MWLFRALREAFWATKRH